VIAYPAHFARLVKIEHTVFALPFAYVGAFLAVDAVPSAADLFWITVAMVGARSLAMALNRLIDAELDARNPRTATRELPAGRLSRAQVIGFSALSLLVFLIAVWQLDPIVRWLWPIPVAAFVVYPYLKRFTWLGHLWLGAVDGLAPVGAWSLSPERSRGRPGRSVRPWRAGSPASTSSTHCSTSTSIAGRGCTRGRRGSACAGCFQVRACSTS
jgi:putative 4-hydroxybenzoate polyprenyltransferase